VSPEGASKDSDVSAFPHRVDGTAPERLFGPMYSVPNWDNAPRTDGTVPRNLFAARLTAPSPVTSAICVGIVPVISLLFSSRDVRAVSVPTVVGMDPLSEFPAKFRSSALVSAPS